MYMYVYFYVILHLLYYIYHDAYAGWNPGRCWYFWDGIHVFGGACCTSRREAFQGASCGVFCVRDLALDVCVCVCVDILDNLPSPLSPIAFPIFPLPSRLFHS